MKKLFLLILLTGCSGSISSWELKAVNEVCETSGGIYSVEIYNPDYLNVTCNSGYSLYIDRSSLQKGEKL